MKEENRKIKKDFTIKQKNADALDKLQETGMNRSFIMDSLLDGFFTGKVASLNLKPKQNLLTAKKFTMNERRDKLICPDFIPFPKGKVSGVVAPGSTGKTFLVLQLCMTHVMTEFYERNRNTRVMAWLSEDSFEDTGDRFQTVCNVMDLQPKDKKLVSDSIDILDSESEVFHFIEFGIKNEMKVSEKFNLFVEACEAYDLIVIDPLIAFFGGDENNNSQAKFFMQQLTQWANTTGKTIILIHHSSKEATNARGASAFFDAFRFLIGVEKYYQVKMVERDDGKLEPAKDVKTGKVKLEEIPDMKHMRKIHVLKDNNNVIGFIKANAGVENPVEFDVQLLPVFDMNDENNYVRPDIRYILPHEPAFDVFQGGVNIANYDSLDSFLEEIKAEYPVEEIEDEEEVDPEFLSSIIKINEAMVDAEFLYDKLVAENESK